MQQKSFDKTRNETSTRNQEYLKVIEEVQDYAILLLDTDGTIRNWNRGGEVIKGYKADEIIGKNFRIFYEEADRQRKLPDSLLAEATKNGRATHEGWRVRKDGTRFWGNVVITALHDDENNVIGFSKVTRDLTEKKIYEDNRAQYLEELKEKNEELRRSEDRFHKMIEEVQDYAIILLDKQGNISNWNKGAEKIKGYKADEIIGKSFTLFYPEADKKSGLPFVLLNEAATMGRAAHEGWRVKKDGTYFWGSIVITALHGDNDEIIGFSKVTRDLTDRKRNEDNLIQYNEQLRQKNEVLEQFAYIASHDIKEPLRKIMSFGDLLINNYAKDLPAQGRNYVERMQHAARRMMQLIDDLLDFASIENTFPEETDLNTIVKHVLNDLELNIYEKHVKITTGNLPTIIARPMQMRQLFQNLLSNAMKFMDKTEPEISITCEKYNNHYKIYVTDNGIGFSEEYKDKIFEVFQRLHSKNQYAGTGIGLAICKKIVELHNGTIEAEGEEGKGATFIIALPENTTGRL